MCDYTKDSFTDFTDEPEPFPGSHDFDEEDEYEDDDIYDDADCDDIYDEDDYYPWADDGYEDFHADDGLGSYED